MWDVKYRPLRFSDVLGQDSTVQVLKARLTRGTALDTSYIFSGGFGRGKTTLSRILGRALLCQDLQKDGEPCNECDNCVAILNETSMAFSELDSASKGTIDNIRQIVDSLGFVVPGAPKRVYVFDEVHRMSRDAQDVLLKPIEDKRLVGIFCTTEAAKIRGTIRSRCEEYPIRRVTREDILARMQMVLSKEGVSYEEDAVLTVIDYCGGHVRDVLNRLEMIAQTGEVSVQGVREYLELGLVTTYYQILLSLGQPSQAMSLLDSACNRVPVEDVAAGLSEAAMNSYRLANGLFTEFTQVDRDSAVAVFDRYRDSCVRLAEFFIRRRPTRTGLLCDIVRCASGVPVDTNATDAPPVQVVAIPVNAPTEIASQSPGASVVSKEAVIQPPVATVPDTKLQTPTPRQPVVRSGRNDGIGSLGSGDPYALTSTDEHSVPREYPRGARVEKQSVRPTAVAAVATDVLTTSEWSRKFEQSYFRSR